MPRVKKVIYEKLGRQECWGQADHENIYIDPRTKGKKLMATILHESLHVIFPLMHEDDVYKAANELARVMWKENFRKVENDPGQDLYKD